MDKYGIKWSEEEIILAFYYYCIIPFGKINKSNPEIIRLASVLGRTPSSVSFKMGNLAHFDPEMRKRNIKGLENASKSDEAVVSRFLNNWEELVFEAKRIEAQYKEQENTDTFPEGNTRLQETKARVNQNFFREAVLASYHHQCCITGITVTSLLIASHIKPWKDSDPKTERTNPSNGLCLNALHDKAFDKGLITVLPDYSIRVSSILKQAKTHDGLDWLMQCDKQTIYLPEKFYPDKLFLEYHNDIVFLP